MKKKQSFNFRPKLALMRPAARGDSVNMNHPKKSAMVTLDKPVYVCYHQGRMKLAREHAGWTTAAGIILSLFAFIRVPSLVAADPKTGTAPLGSLNFKPMAGRPVGWRGDWTGQFPGATPPMTWGRRVKGSTTEIRYQADKPIGEPRAGSQPLEYFTLKEWLVAGPYTENDPAKNIEHDFLGGEEKVEPVRNAKAGGATWKFLRVSMENQSRHYHNEGTCGDLNVDFVYVFGNLPETVADKKPEALDNQVAYAHTYFHSPAGGPMMLRVNYAAAAIKVFLNGRRRGQDKVWFVFQLDFSRQPLVTMPHATAIENSIPRSLLSRSRQRGQDIYWFVFSR
jgi:hypothetical protein